MESSRRARLAPLLVLALGAAAFAYGFLLRDPAVVAFRDPRLLQAQVALALLAAGLPFLFRSLSTKVPLYLFAGAFGFSVAYTFIVGPGNLWPIALVLFAIMVLLPIALGTGLALLVGLLGRGRPAPPGVR